MCTHPLVYKATDVIAAGRNNRFPMNATEIGITLGTRHARGQVVESDRNIT